MDAVIFIAGFVLVSAVIVSIIGWKIDRDRMDAIAMNKDTQEINTAGFDD